MNLEKNWEDDMRGILDGMIASSDLTIFQEEIENLKEALVQKYVVNAKIAHQQMEQEMDILRKELKRRETVYDYD